MGQASLVRACHRLAFQDFTDLLQEIVQCLEKSPLTVEYIYTLDYQDFEPRDTTIERLADGEYRN